MSNIEQKIIYALDENDYYIGEHICQKFPDTGEWLYINRYTEIVPPESKDGFVLKFNKDIQQWIYIQSYVGKSIYNKQNYQESMICQTIGLPDGYTDIAPIDNKPCIWNETLQQWEVDIVTYKQQKLQEISEKFNIALVNGHFYSQTLQIEIDCRRSNTKNDLQNVENIIVFLSATSGQGLDVYRGYTNPETGETQYAYNVTLQQLEQLRLEMIQYGLRLYNRKWQLEDAIANTQSQSELDAISIDFNNL